MQVSHEIQSTKSAHRCGYFQVKKFLFQRKDMIVCGTAAIFPAMTMSDFTISKKVIYQRNDMIVCGAAAIFSAMAMFHFTITTDIIGKGKMNRYYAWMNDWESS